MDEIKTSLAEGATGTKSAATRSQSPFWTLDFGLPDHEESSKKSTIADMKNAIERLKSVTGKSQYTSSKVKK